MRFTTRIGIASAASIFGLAPLARGALQVALHEVNTSVGLLPTSTANKWKLQTDPAIVDPVLSSYIPVNGSLCNSFDPTKFKLAVNPLSLTYALGDTVEGLGAYQVTQFDVETKNGGLVDVKQDPSDPTKDII